MNGNGRTKDSISVSEIISILLGEDEDDDIEISGVHFSAGLKQPGKSATSRKGGKSK